MADDIELSSDEIFALRVYDGQFDKPVVMTEPFRLAVEHLREIGFVHYELWYDDDGHDYDGSWELSEEGEAFLRRADTL